MTGLLVSVRDSAEAAAAQRGGADLIDIKEPRAGALGPAEVETWHKIAQVVGAERPLSVALGELQEGSVGDLASQAAGMRFAKIGLAGCGSAVDWSRRWREAIACLPQGVDSVAVIYADHTLARAPLPRAILQQAIQIGCAALLVDTYSKAHGHLFDHLDEQALLPLLREAQHAGLKTVLGGSLRGGLVPRALALAPHYIAVRGAVCPGDRSNAVDPTLVESLAKMIHAHSPTAC